MEALGELMKSPWFWITIGITLLSGVAYRLYPQQTNQDMIPVIEDYQSSNVLDVVVFTEDKEEALKEIKNSYKEWEVLNEYYIEEKRAWVFRLVRKEINGGDK